MNNAGQPMMMTMAEKTTMTTLPDGNTVIMIRLTTKIDTSEDRCLSVYPHRQRLEDIHSLTFNLSQTGGLRIPHPSALAPATSELRTTFQCMMEHELEELVGRLPIDYEDNKR
jgi:hypothetical protein